MKRTTIVLILCWCAIGWKATGQTVDGFQGFSWGTSLDKMKNQLRLQLFDNKGDSIMYAAYAVPTLGGARVAMSCLFYKNQFAGVMIHTRAGADSRALLTYLKGEFGEPEQAKFGDALVWHLPKTTVLFNDVTSETWATISPANLHSQERGVQASPIQESTGGWSTTAILFLSVVILLGGPFVAAQRMERTRHLSFSDHLPYTWGFYFGVMAIVITGFALLAAFATEAFDNAAFARGIAAALAWGVPGYFVIKRRKWAWITLTVLSLNPVLWGINYVYGKNRWNEFD